MNLREFEYNNLFESFGVDTLKNNERTLNEWLAAARMTVSSDEPTPAVLGLLVCGINPRDYIPGAWV